MRYINLHFTYLLTYLLQENVGEMLFVIVMEAISREFSGLTWELLYADDLVVIAETE